MLQISLHKGEFMTIGDNIKIYCTKAGFSDSVTLGIDAPRDLKILRTKHAAEELKIAANAGDREAIEALKKLDAAKSEREARLEERRLRAAKRNENRRNIAAVS